MVFNVALQLHANVVEKDLARDYVRGLLVAKEEACVLAAHDVALHRLDCMRNVMCPENKIPRNWKHFITGSESPSCVLFLDKVK